jgi:hypothetical protein
MYYNNSIFKTSLGVIVVMNYSINNSTAIYDIIDGDIVIIHLETGNYYNLSDTGASIWQLIVKTVSYENLVTALSANYLNPGPDVEQDIKAFLDQLENEGLVVQVSTEENGLSKEGSTKIETKKVEYTRPILNVFSDMQDFLLVDPIHEVDEKGLPKYTPPKPDDE